MPAKKISLAEFIEMKDQYPVLDVRSPGEFNHAHIPGAISVPLFTDEERRVVGTAYKQQSRQIAIKIGLDYFGVKMKGMVELVEQWLAEHNRPVEQQAANGRNTVIVHCWRGGMRSAAVAWLLDLYGFTVYTLAGGYKAYRQWVRMQFEQPCGLRVLGGYTGSGKTIVLHELQHMGIPVIDLEALALHKGSAFGGMDNQIQPSQEMFENLLAKSIARSKAQGNAIWIEDESQRIGNLQIPMPFWNTMRNSPVYFADIPFQERLQYLTAEYGKYSKEKLVNAVIRIQKRLGGLETKNAINHLLEDDHSACFAILLRYYDKWYGRGLYNRDNIKALLVNVPLNSFDPQGIVAAILEQQPNNIVPAGN